MVQHPHNLLIMLLVLLIGIGPVGSVSANPHACAPDKGQSAVTDDSGHTDHGRMNAIGDSRVDLPSNHDCDGCEQGCCQGGHCKMSHCSGSAAALQSAATPEFDRFATNDATLIDQRLLAGRLTPPLRPPQV